MDPEEKADVPTGIYTTLKLLRSHHACASGYAKLRASLPPHYGDDRPITFQHIVESNGAADAIWALRAVPDHLAKERDRIARTLAADCAEHVLPIFEKNHPGDLRPRKAIEAARMLADAYAAAANVANAANAAADAYAAAANVANAANAYAAYAAAANVADASAANAANAAKAAAYAGDAYAAVAADAAKENQRKWQGEALLALIGGDGKQ